MKTSYHKKAMKKTIFFKIIINCNNVSILGENQTTKHACKKYMLTKHLDSKSRKEAYTLDTLLIVRLYVFVRVYGEG